MVGQKQRIIRRFEREAKAKYEKMEKAGVKITCLCDKPKWHLVNFNIDEIKQIINWKDDDEVSSKGGITITDVKVVGICSKCRKDDDEVLKYKDGSIIPDEDISCLNYAFGTCQVSTFSAQKDELCIGIEVQKDIHTARRCILSTRLGCDNKRCLNESCPLHKRWKKELIIQDKEDSTLCECGHDMNFHDVLENNACHEMYCKCMKFVPQDDCEGGRK